MRKLYLIFFIIIGCANSTGSDSDIDESDTVLDALRERSGVFFDNNTRNYYTSINDPGIFETIFPGTENSCGYILRFYFYTNIHLSSNSNQLLSMDGSKFLLSNTSSNDVVTLTREVIKIIGGMSMGANELKSFLEDHPNAVL